MDHRPHTSPATKPAEPFALEVFRIRAGEAWSVIFLTARVTGCFTHWVKGRSRYCDPTNCRWGCPKAERVWKGYDLVERFDDKRSLWIPCVLEITEHLELDLRGVYARGQGWMLSRDEESKGERSPVKGRLVKSMPPAEVSPPINFDAVLRNVYHVERIDLTTKNPMPARVMVTARSADKVQVVEAASEEPPTAEHWQHIRRQAELAKKNGVKS